jgi:hypothetical protein
MNMALERRCHRWRPADGRWLAAKAPCGQGRRQGGNGGDVQIDQERGKVSVILFVSKLKLGLQNVAKKSGVPEDFGGCDGSCYRGQST